MFEKQTIGILLIFAGIIGIILVWRFWKTKLIHEIKRNVLFHFFDVFFPDLTIYLEKWFYIILFAVVSIIGLILVILA